MVKVTIYSFIRAEPNGVVFGATQTDNGKDVYVHMDLERSCNIIRLLDFEEPVVEVDPEQIIGNIPVPSLLTKLRRII